MKKATTELLKTAGDEMRPEYDFRGAVRGKYYKPLHRGYTVHIHRADGTTIVQRFTNWKRARLCFNPMCVSIFPTPKPSTPRCAL